ncbi:MAG TPA: ABC transporter permease [Actinomycetes bacterium]|nr:ABC transporter permease [Actinomycetes bacterium]
MTPERPGPRRTLRHALALCGRNLRPLLRTPQLLVADALRPIMLTLLFTYMLGGSIVLPGGGRYASYLIPGILVQQVAFSSAITAAGLAADVRGGILDRFRSLPIARSAYLIARILSDGARMLLTMVLIVAVGLVVGFRFGGGPVATVAGLSLALAFGVAFAWVSAATALVVRDPEAVQVLWFVSLMPLIFASSIFASPSRMPGWLQPVVRANPLTVVADATRALLLGGPVATPALHAVAWIAAISVVAFTWAVRRYRAIA